MMEKGFPQNLWVKVVNKHFDDEVIEGIEKYLENNAPTIYKYYYIKVLGQHSSNIKLFKLYQSKYT